MRTEALLVTVSLFWAVLANRPFVAAALQGRDVRSEQTWLFGAAVMVMLLSLIHISEPTRPY